MRKLDYAVLAIVIGLAAGAATASGTVAPGASPASALAGTWEGTLTLPGRTLRVVFNIAARPDGSASATMDSPDQGAHGIPVEGVTVDDRAVRLEVRTVRGSFAGRLADASTLVGTWSQPGGSLPLTLRRRDAAAATPAPPPAGLLTPVLGTWEGTLKVPGGTLRVVFHVAAKPDGSASATMDSPDQNARGIPVPTVTVQGDAVTFEVPAVGGRYTGMLKGPGLVAGTWSQGGADLPLDLKRPGDTTRVRRPQEPAAPLPYNAVEVTVPDPGASLTLAGTLTIPSTGGPFPAVVLVTGSGPQDRDETVFGHKPFLVLADALTRRGIAVLRLDDRGTGASTGVFTGSTDDDFVGDALAAVAFLKGRAGIDPGAIGLIGHSEGGIVAPKAAARSGDVAFIVLLEAPGVPLRRIIEEQSALILEAGGADAAAVAKAAETQRRCFAALDRNPDDAQARAAIVAALRSDVPDWDSRSDEQKKALDAAFALEAAQMTSPWMRGLLDYDPATALERVHCPVLAIGGTKDLQVPAKENLGAIAAALRAGGNHDVTIRTLQGLNHLLQPAATGAPSEYVGIETTIAPEALQLIGDWILGHVPAAKPRP